MKPYKYHTIAGSGPAGSSQGPWDGYGFPAPSRTHRRVCQTVVVIALAAVLLLFGCTKDPNNGSGGRKTGRATFTVEVPGQQTQAVRSWGEIEERHLDELDLLLFELEGNAEKFVTNIPIDGADITNHTDQPYKTFFAEGMPVDPSKQYRIVLIANARTLLAGAALTEGLEKQTLLDGITSFATDVPWDLATPVYLPMWGETADPVTLSSPETVIPTIQLLRSVVRLDIALSETAAEKFELDQIAIYNVTTRGKVVPDADVYSFVTRRVSGASIPADADISVTEVTYTTADPFSSGPLYLGEYDPEDAARTEENRIRLLVSGRYLADNPANNTVTWYEIPLQEAGTGDPFPLLRNFSYEITITDVKDAGYHSPEELLNYNAAILSADIVPWDESQKRDESLAGTTIFKVSQTEFHFNADGRYGELSSDFIVRPDYTDHLLDIYTNLPTDFQITKITDENGNILSEAQRWVSIEQGITVYYYLHGFWYDAKHIDDQYYLLVEGNGGSSSRTAKIHLKSGDKEIILTITQDYLPDCGREDNFQSETLWGNPYESHIYVSPINKLVRCWMLDNLMEPDTPYIHDTEYVIEHNNAWFYNMEKVYEEDFRPCPDG